MLESLPIYCQAPNFVNDFFIKVLYRFNIFKKKLLKIFNKHCEPFEAIEFLNKNSPLLQTLTLIHGRCRDSDSLLQHTFMVKYANRYLPVQWESSRTTSFQRFPAAIFSSRFFNLKARYFKGNFVRAPDGVRP